MLPPFLLAALCVPFPSNQISAWRDQETHSWRFKQNLLSGRVPGSSHLHLPGTQARRFDRHGQVCCRPMRAEPCAGPPGRAPSCPGCVLVQRSFERGRADRCGRTQSSSMCLHKGARPAAAGRAPRSCVSVARPACVRSVRLMRLAKALPPHALSTARAQCAARATGAAWAFAA